MKARVVIASRVGARSGEENFIMNQDNDMMNGQKLSVNQDADITNGQKLSVNQDDDITNGQKLSVNQDDDIMNGQKLSVNQDADITNGQFVSIQDENVPKDEDIVPKDDVRDADDDIGDPNNRQNLPFDDDGEAIICDTEVIDDVNVPARDDNPAMHDVAEATFGLDVGCVGEREDANAVRDRKIVSDRVNDSVCQGSRRESLSFRAKDSAGSAPGKRNMVLAKAARLPVSTRAGASDNVAPGSARGIRRV